TTIVSGLTVNAERMLRNLESSRGLVFSGPLLLELTAKGMRREDAYRVVQDHAMAAWREDGDFRARVSSDAAVRPVMTERDFGEVFRLQRYPRHVDAIFARVFGAAGAAASA